MSREEQANRFVSRSPWKKLFSKARSATWLGSVQVELRLPATQMKMLRLAFVLLALAGATACGAGKQKPFETADEVAALLGNTWRSTKGSPSFD